MAKHITESDSQFSQWNSTYTTVQSQSGSWGGGGGDDVLVSTKVRASSANWDNTYTTVSIGASDWDSAFFIANGGYVKWDSVHTTVQSQSANWSGLPQLTRFTILESDFTGGTASVACPGLYGTAISSGVFQTASLAGGPNHPGVVAFRDSTTANGGYRLMTDTNAFHLSGGEKAKFIFRLDTAALSSTIRMGFLDTTTVAMPTDGVFFDIRGFGTASYSLSGITRANSTAVATATNYTIISGAWYRGEIELNSDASIATFSLYSSDAALVWTNTVNSGIPKSVGRETGFGIVVTEASVNAASDILSVDYVSLEINRTLTR